VDLHRRRFRLGRLDLPSNTSTAHDVETARFELWPNWLRKAANPLVLVDVGANLGEFTAAAARISRVDTVHAFEPQRVCHSRLREVLKGLANGYLHPVAVGRESGEVEFYCTGNARMASVLAPLPAMAGNYEPGDMSVEERGKVPIVRLDDVIPANTTVDLLKIDVQGYELAVLEGAVRTLERTRTLLLEVNYVAHYEGAPCIDQVVEAVRMHGFRTFGMSAPYSGTEGPLWADAMFVRNS
jgi:FkbM family methyltransferase